MFHKTTPAILQRENALAGNGFQIHSIKYFFHQTTTTAFIKKCLSIETNYCPLNYTLGVLLLINFLHSQKLTFASFCCCFFFPEISKQILFRNNFKNIRIASGDVLGPPDPVPGNISAYAYFHPC